MNDLEQRLLDLEPGDPISYKLLEEIENSKIEVETISIYTDSVGFIEEWRIGNVGSVVVDALNGDPMVRKTQHIEDELPTPKQKV